MGFVHLHSHTEYSALDSTAPVRDYIAKVKASGMTACAITDHGTGAGLVTFYDECKKQGIKPILGCEMYEAPESRHDRSSDNNGRKYFHLILLVKNEQGYKNLCKLITRSNTEGYYYKPRIDFELLEQFHDGLICLSACVAGRIPSAILSRDLEYADRLIKEYKALFGEDFYLEIQNHGLREEQIIRDVMPELARRNGVKIVATNDCHYVNTEDAKAHEWMLCIQTKKTIEDPDRLIYHGDYSVKTEAEMQALFPEYPEAIANTCEIADKCSYDFDYGNYRMPKVVIPEAWGADYFGYLESEAWKGYEKRYPEGHIYRDRAREDLRYELSVIKEMGFAEYFLDTRKTINWAREHNILVGPGRGSAAGSRMCYCLGITDIEPIKYNLLFSRFLNPERISMPDIDVDYDFSYKDDIVRSEAESNGVDKFAKIQTFGTMQAKGVIKDCCRVAGQPVSVGNKFGKLIGDAATLQEAYDADEDLRNYISSEPAYQEIWEIAKKLEGRKKSESTHACGHIPTPVPCEDLFPCSVDQETGYLVCQYDMTQAEHLGNLKKDLLMLRNLTIIDIAHKSVKRRYGIDVPLWNEDVLNDRNALSLLSAGDTNGIFQLESDGMKRVVEKLQPDCFEDIIALVALYRPGPMDNIPEYINIKHTPSAAKYLTPELEPILESTNSIIVYQEQVMQITMDLAGFSMGRADVVRKAMGKKKLDIMQEERQRFIYGDEKLGIDGCVKRGISEESASALYDQMSKFASYAFNKSHAAAYAAIGMQTAYLKANYPADFYAGLLTSVMDKTDKLSLYAGECRRRGIKIQPPDINKSDTVFSVMPDGETLCYGLTSIKKVGEDLVKRIIAERDKNGAYTSLYDFMKRIPDASSGAIDSLIKAGAFDCTGYNRPTLAAAISNLQSIIKGEKKSVMENQVSFFDFDDTPAPDPELKVLKDYSDIEKAMFELESTGQFISAHPIQSMIEKGPNGKYNYCPLDLLMKFKDKAGEKLISVAGIITKVRTIYTKKGEKMAFVSIEDGTGAVDLVVFPTLYGSKGNILNENTIITAKGRVSQGDDDETSLSLITESLEFVR